MSMFTSTVLSTKTINTIKYTITVFSTSLYTTLSMKIPVDVSFKLLIQMLSFPIGLKFLI